MLPFYYLLRAQSTSAQSQTSCSQRYKNSSHILCVSTVHFNVTNRHLFIVFTPGWLSQYWERYISGATAEALIQISTVGLT